MEEKRGDPPHSLRSVSDFHLKSPKSVRDFGPISLGRELLGCQKLRPRALGWLGAGGFGAVGDTTWSAFVLSFISLCRRLAPNFSPKPCKVLGAGC